MKKIAYPHIEQKCKFCENIFYVDLRWEDKHKGHKFLKDDKISNDEDFDVEKEKQIVTCPYCETSWLSSFSKKKDSLDIREDVVLKNPELYLKKDVPNSFSVYSNNFYKMFKLAKLEEDWWKNFIFHFNKTLDFEFPNKVEEFSKDINEEIPSLVLNNGRSFTTSFGQYEINFNFSIHYKTFVYNAKIQLLFNGYIANLLNYKGKQVFFEKPFSVPFKGIKLLVQRKEVDNPKYNTHKYKTLGVEDANKVGYINIPLDDSIPYVAISKIKKLILTDKLEYKDSYGYADNED